MTTSELRELCRQRFDEMERRLMANKKPEDRFQSPSTFCSLSALRAPKNDKALRRLIAIGIVAGGYGGDCQEKTCNELPDDIDFHLNKVNCRKIESLLPMLNDYVADEFQQMRL